MFGPLQSTRGQNAVKGRRRYSALGCWEYAYLSIFLFPAAAAATPLSFVSCTMVCVCLRQGERRNNAGKYIPQMLLGPAAACLSSSGLGRSSSAHVPQPDILFIAVIAVEISISGIIVRSAMQRAFESVYELVSPLGAPFKISHRG